MDSKVPGQAAETISMASMPLIPQTEPSAVLQDNRPGLFAAGDIITMGSIAPPAKKSLNFESTMTTMAPMAPTALVEQVIVYDTAVQTAITSQGTQETTSVIGGATGTSLQTNRVARHPNAIKHHKDRPLHQVFLPKELVQGKQFDLEPHM